MAKVPGDTLTRAKEWRRERKLSGCEKTGRIFFSGACPPKLPEPAIDPPEKKKNESVVPKIDKVLPLLGKSLSSRFSFFPLRTPRKTFSNFSRAPPLPVQLDQPRRETSTLFSQSFPFSLSLSPSFPLWTQKDPLKNLGSSPKGAATKPPARLSATFFFFLFFSLFLMFHNELGSTVLFPRLSPHLFQVFFFF